MHKKIAMTHRIVPLLRNVIFMISVLSLLNALSCIFEGFTYACINRVVSLRVVFAKDFSLPMLVAKLLLWVFRRF